jgi:hypothetical protein
MTESLLGAAVFLEDADLYTHAMSLYAARVPAYIYLTSDGPLPVPAHGIKNTTAAIIKYWNGQTTFPVDGITQETCRDFAHTSYGISSIGHVAETARIQGNDLWRTSVGSRVKAALELHSQFETGTPIPNWLCNGTIGRSMDPGKSGLLLCASCFFMYFMHLACGYERTNRCVCALVVEPGYNALSFRMGEEMPNTEKLVLQQRPAAIGEAQALFIGWETLTNAENPY